LPRAKKQHLTRRPDGRYRCRYKDQDFYGSTEEEALAAREEYKRRELLGVKQPSQISVADFAAQWLPMARREGVTAVTYNWLLILAEKLINALGDVPVASVLPSQIKAVYTTEFQGLSDSYIKAAKRLYVSMFDAALADGIITRNPAAEKSAAPHRGTFGGHRAITPQEREWITTLCTDHRAWPAVMAMLYAGLRPAEAKTLDIDRDVDFDAGVIRLSQFAHIDDGNHYIVTEKGKTAKSARTIPLFSPLRAALKGRSGPLVASADGSPLTIQAWKRLWESYASDMEAAINGLQKRWYGRTRAHKQILAEGGSLPSWISFTVRPYDLRHSFATWCRDNGVELHTVVDWMGHADATMLMRVYDEVSDSRSAAEAAKLEASIKKVSNGGQIGGQPPQKS